VSRVPGPLLSVLTPRPKESAPPAAVPLPPTPVAPPAPPIDSVPPPAPAPPARSDGDTVGDGRNDGGVEYVAVEDGETEGGSSDEVGVAVGCRDDDVDGLTLLLALRVTVPLAEGEELAPTDRDAVADDEALALSDPLADAVTLGVGDAEGVGLAEA